MHPNNKDKFRYCRIDKWHEAGYTGKGVKVAVLESIDESDDHGHACADIIRQVAPDAEVVGRPRPGIHMVNGKLTEDSYTALHSYYLGLFLEDCAILSLSIGGGSCEESGALEHERLHPFTTMLVSAGNDGGEIDKSSSAYRETWIACGGAILSGGKPIRWHDSETGEKLDIMGFTGLYTSWGKYFLGTSAAPPFLAGCLALWFQWHLEAYGRFPNFDESMAFLKEHAEDMESDGRDELTGHGLFRLPAEIPEIENPLEPSPVEPDPPTIPDEPIHGGDPMIICIDPGHGGPDPGAISPEGIKEKITTLRVAEQLAMHLQRAGVQVVLTRDKDTDVAPGLNDSEELAARAKVANDAGADFFVSIHCNSVTDPEVSGFEVFHWPGSINGECLAVSIANAFAITSGLKFRKVEGARYQVLHDTHMPAVLIELGFLSNTADCVHLKEIACNDKDAIGIAFGILEMKERG